MASLLRAANSLHIKASPYTVAKLQTTSRSFHRMTTALHDTADSNNYYISTPIYYVNGQPHLGHAYTSVASDVIARYQRCKGKQVFFLTGTDEHGQKVEQSAVIANQTPIEFADTVSASFKSLTQLLMCSNDDFIRTTQSRHKTAVDHFWKTLKDNNQIYLGAYEGRHNAMLSCTYAQIYN